MNKDLAQGWSSIFARIAGLSAGLTQINGLSVSDANPGVTNRSKMDAWAARKNCHRILFIKSTLSLSLIFADSA
jgi:hypothetical protein